MSAGVTVTPATVNNLNALIAQAGPGGVVDFEPGVYPRGNNGPLLTNGGLVDSPITVRGNGAILRSNRPDPWVPGGLSGYPWFQFGPGASHLIFSGFAFENVGNGCIRLGAPNVDLTFEDMTALNVQRFLENGIVSGQTDATITGLTIRRITVDRHSKDAIRLQYDTHDALIEKVAADSQRVDGDNFAMGVHATGTVHDVTHRRVVSKNCHYDKGLQYWNGDGFVAEAGTYRLTYEDCRASGHTDGGFDLKGDDHLLERCVAWDNKRNFRLWGRATLIDPIGLNPNKRGGSGTQAQVHTADDAQVEVIRGLFSDCDADTIVFDADGTSQIHTSGDITRHPQSTLFTEETGASVTFGDVTDQFCS